MTWADSNYTYKKKITIDNTKVSGSLGNFPVLVSRIDADLTDCLSNGYDIKFYNQNETQKLFHDIEKWDKSTGELVAWVKIPRVSSNTSHSGNIFYMYYEYPGKTIPEAVPAGVWSGNNYVSVWHGTAYSSQYLTVDNKVDYTGGTNIQGAASDGTNIYIAGKGGLSYPGIITKNDEAGNELARIDLNDYDEGAGSLPNECRLSDIEYHVSGGIGYIYMALIQAGAIANCYPMVYRVSSATAELDMDPVMVLNDTTRNDGFDTEGITYFNDYWWLSAGGCEDCSNRGSKGLIYRYTSGMQYVRSYKTPILGGQGFNFWKEGDIIYLGIGVHTGPEYDHPGLSILRYDEEADMFSLMKCLTSGMNQYWADQGWCIVDQTTNKPGMSGCWFATRNDADGTVINDAFRSSPSSSLLNYGSRFRVMDSAGSQHGLNYGNPTGNTSGKCGYAIEKGNDISGYDIGRFRNNSWVNETLFNGLNDFSIECWIYPTNTASAANQRIFCNMDAGGDADDGGKIVLDFEGDESNDPIALGYDIGTYHFTRAGPIKADTWQYIVATYDADTPNDSGAKLYISGNYTGSSNSMVGQFDIYGTANQYFNSLGFSAPGDDQSFIGKLDEIRISDTPRNHEWVWTAWNSMNIPSTFLTFGAQDDGSTTTSTSAGEKDLFITGSTYSINCWCSRWDVQNYNVIVETWMNKTELQTLRANITPQAVGELYTILGRPRYYDATWQGENTIKLSPNTDFQLSNMRNDTLIYVKNISDTPEKGHSGWLNVKIEGMVSGTGSL